MRRRGFIGLLGGAVTWPLTARAQQTERVRRIGALMPWAADNPEANDRISVFQRELQQLGWTNGRNIRLELRWAAGNADDTRKQATELVALAPDVILASTSLSVAALLQATRTVPIVFVQVADPVGAGFVARLGRPGGNATGITLFEYSLSGKWLELLREVAPGVQRAAVLRDPALAAGIGAASPGAIGQFAVIQTVASTLGVEVTPLDVRDVADIEPAIKSFALSSDVGLIVAASVVSALSHEVIVTQAARYRLPAIYSDRAFVIRGGLISYGPDRIDSYRRAAAYIDRILKGEMPADLPVQASTKYELMINVKTAKALGLTIPPSLLARADEVIE